MRGRIGSLFGSIAVVTLVAIQAGAQCIGQPGKLSYGDPPRPRLGTMSPPTCGGGIGTLLSDYVDNNGEQRYACLSQPSNLAAGLQLPLVVYLHPSLFTP